MGDLFENWEKLKKYWRTEFNELEIMSDENEHYIIFKIFDCSYIIGYLHFPKTNKVPYSSFYSEISNYIEFLASNVSEAVQINLCANRQLYKICQADKILNFPDNVSFYFINEELNGDNLEFTPQDKIKSVEYRKHHDEFNKPWYHRCHIQVVNDSRFEKWENWVEKGYNRRWYYSNDINEFESDWDFTTIFNVDEIFIDDGLFGFYVVWK